MNRITNTNIIQAMEDPELFGGIFKRRMLRADSWVRWKVFLAVLFGLPRRSRAEDVPEVHGQDGCSYSGIPRSIRDLRQAQRQEFLRSVGRRLLRVFH